MCEELMARWDMVYLRNWKTLGVMLGYDLRCCTKSPRIIVTHSQDLVEQLLEGRYLNRVFAM